jgi:hypothetical protein
MPDHRVTLKYRQEPVAPAPESNPGDPPKPKITFSADPKVIKVRPGHTIEFVKESNVPGTFEVSFPLKELFSANDADFLASGTHREGKGVVTVKPEVQVVATTYHCVLRGPSNEILAESHETGGGIEPDSGL